MDTFITYLQSPIGWLKISGSDGGIECIDFHDDRGEAVNEDHPLADQSRLELQEYLDKARTAFTLPVAPQGTTFQHTVWKELLAIPFGVKRTYADIAVALGSEKKIRAVGNANGRNPIAIVIPCHRVIGSDGTLTGYAGGLWRKQWLLEHEASISDASLVFNNYTFDKAMKSFAQFLDELNNEFLRLHTAKEDLFWKVKMGLAEDPVKCQHEQSEAENALNHFAQDASKLQVLREYEAQPDLSDGERVALAGWKAYFEVNVIESPEAQKMAAHIVELEGEMQIKRGGMGLGYIHPATGEKVRASTNELSNMLLSEKDEGMRKAAYDALLGIGPFILANGFIEIIKERNKLARSLGYEDYYDYKVQRTEGMTKKELFALLDDLEVRTREANKRSMESFEKAKGSDALQPWNFTFYSAGDMEAKKDPYLPFAQGLERWVHSFAAMGIRYRGAKLTLDLVDRKGKYENGFMHGPVPAWLKNGSWNPATINFTANAIPNRVGSGNIALNTLFHEGGHAAHFANIQMNAPCYGQEFAPTSVAYAETQSMFLDALLVDADWLTRYAKNTNGETMPMEIIEQYHSDEQPFLARRVRAMLGVCYAEKWFYEASDEDLTPEKILSMISELEKKMHHLPGSPRPILAVPHILAGESSAYYHGYVLAEMAVHQTRKYFFEKYGYITDNPNIGPELENGYWKWGYSVPFFELVKRLTGKPFSADALVDYSTRTVDEAIAEAHHLYDAAQKRERTALSTKLDATIDVIHGREKIASFSNGDFTKANENFRSWVVQHYPKSA